jgi:hypothetical protein
LDRDGVVEEASFANMDASEAKRPEIIERRKVWEEMYEDTEGVDVDADEGGDCGLVNGGDDDDGAILR